MIDLSCTPYLLVVLITGYLSMSAYIWYLEWQVKKTGDRIKALQKEMSELNEETD